MADIIYYIILYMALCIGCILLCAISYSIISTLWEDHKWKKQMKEWEADMICFMDHHISEDPIGIGDPHSDTIEKSFTKNDFRYSNEYWKYTFEDGKSEKSDHPLSNEELKPLVDIHGPVKPEGLEVIKL